jgi:hypothetical protein
VALTAAEKYFAAKKIQTMVRGKLVRNKIGITEIELMKTSMIKSKILYSKVTSETNIISEKTLYRPIARDILETMSFQDRKDHTTFRWKETDEGGVLGFNWDNKIKMSIQNKNATGTLKEIIQLVKLNNMSINLSIKLETGRIILFKKDYS